MFGFESFAFNSNYDSLANINYRSYGKDYSISAIDEIARRMLSALSKRTKELDFDIEFSDKAVEEIGKAGFDPVYGARPLRRAIQQQIEDKLSEEMLEGKLTPGKKYLCDHGENGFEFIEQE